jgi:CHAD domain-containing protein
MDPLVDHCDQIIERLRQLVPAALGGDDAKAVHDARVATRRMSAALKLLAPLVSDEQRKPLSKALRKLRRRLGDVRDLDVMLGHLKGLRKARSHAAAVRWLSERIEKARDAVDARGQSEHVSRTLSKLGVWWGVREQIVGRHTEEDALLARSLHAQLCAFSELSDRNSIPKDDRRADPHELRIAGKSLRYTLEIAQAAGHPVGTRTLKLFKKMQDALGLWHDYVVLAERAMRESSDAMLAHHDAQLQRRVLGLTQLILRRSESQLSRFAELWQSNGEELKTAILAAFPEQATESRTDRDPSGSDGPTSREDLPQDDPAAV